MSVALVPSSPASPMAAERRISFLRRHGAELREYLAEDGYSLVLLYLGGVCVFCQIATLFVPGVVLIMGGFINVFDDDEIDASNPRRVDVIGKSFLHQDHLPLHRARGIE